MNFNWQLHVDWVIQAKTLLTLWGQHYFKLFKSEGGGGAFHPIKFDSENLSH